MFNLIAWVYKAYKKQHSSQLFTIHKNNALRQKKSLIELIYYA